MKSIKPVLIVLALLSFPLSARSQTNTWNVKAGINFSTFGGANIYRTGYQVGVGMEHAFNGTWSLQPSLLFITKGAKGRASYPKEYHLSYKSYYENDNPMYIEVPVMAAARFELAKNFNIVLSAGPYFAFGVGGKYQVTHGDGRKVSEPYFDKFSTRTDVGMGTGITFELSRFSLGVNGEWGFPAANSYRRGNNTYSLSLGYRF